MENLNIILGLLILIISITLIEVRDFRIVSMLLGLLGILLSVYYIMEGVILEIIPLAIFSIIFMPIVLYYFTSKTRRTCELPIIEGGRSFALLVILVTLVFTFFFFLPGSFSVQWAFVVIGVYGLLIKTDLRKSIVSLMILIYSLHLFTGSFDVLVEVVIMMFSAILFLVLLYLAHRIFVLKGSLSTKDLKELQF